MEHEVSLTLFDRLDDVLVILLASVAAVSLFRWLRASPILGYLIAGVIIGPYAFAFVRDVEGIKTLGELGVVFLLFTIGLKMSLHRLRVLRRYVFGLGLAQVFVTASIIIAMAMWAGIALEPAVLIGSGLALSSTAVVLQVLSERGELASKFGRISFAVLLFQDLSVVVLLVLILSLGQSDESFASALIDSGVKAVLALGAIIGFGRLFLRPVYRWIAQLGNQEVFIAVNLLVVLSTAAITAYAGLSMELGAFLAGMLLAETEYRHQVEADIEPFHGLLLGLFFMTVGMAIDLQVVVEHLPAVIALICIVTFLKSGILYVLCRLFKIPVSAAIRVALPLATGGEFVFVIFAPAMSSGILSPDVGSLLYVSVAISMGLTPFLAGLAKNISQKVLESEADTTLQAATDEIGDLRGHVVISGFGRVGKIVAKLLTDQMIPYVAIDNNMARVSEGRVQGYPIYFGDARRHQVMRALGAEKAKAIVVCMNSSSSSVRTTMMLRRHYPTLEVYVRMRDDEHHAKLSQAGAVVVMPENLEPSLQLGASVLTSLGTPTDEVNQLISTFRKSYAERFGEENSDEPEEETPPSQSA